jgi:hypothetical protein
VAQSTKARTLTSLPASAGTSPSGNRTARLNLRVGTLISIKFLAHAPSQSSSTRLLLVFQRQFFPVEPAYPRPLDYDLASVIVCTVATLMATGALVGRFLNMYQIEVAIINVCHSGQGIGDVAYPDGREPHAVDALRAD